jgi:hypothetical protein
MTKNEAMKRMRKNNSNPVVIDIIDCLLSVIKADFTSCEIMILDRKFLHEISGFTLKQMNATKRVPENTRFRKILLVYRWLSSDAFCPTGATYLNNYLSKIRLFQNDTYAKIINQNREIATRAHFCDLSRVSYLSDSCYYDTESCYRNVLSCEKLMLCLHCHAHRKGIQQAGGM